MEVEWGRGRLTDVGRYWQRNPSQKPTFLNVCLRKGNYKNT